MKDAGWGEVRCGKGLTLGICVHGQSVVRGVEGVGIGLDGKKEHQCYPRVAFINRDNLSGSLNRRSVPRKQNP